MNQFNFKSQPCTSCEQSERLLALGLKKETADFYTPIKLNPDKGSLPCLPDFWTSDEPFYRNIREGSIPAWSLGRLIEMMPESIHLDSFADTHYYRTLLPSKIIYMKYNHTWIWQSDKQNDFDKCVDAIEWLINEGYFNKEYLEV